METLALPNRITTIFLDMNGTFMFGHDRLGRDQDFNPVYRDHGGENLTAQGLNDAVRRVVAQLDEIYSAGQHDTYFPSVFDIVCQMHEGALEPQELGLIEKTIASHELGQVSEDCKRVLVSLSKEYSLYVLSNLWSKSEPWKHYLSGRLGESVFSGWIFSSDIGINKPAPGFFERALAMANASPQEVAMVGDDYKRDILPAAQLGMTTVWIAPEATMAESADHIAPDFSQLYGN